MMSTGSKRRKVTVDIKPQNKFDRASVFERLGNQSHEKQKKWKDSGDTKTKPKKAHKALEEDAEFVKKTKSSTKADGQGTSKKSREIDVGKYSSRGDDKDPPEKPHKHGGTHKTMASHETTKGHSKHKTVAEQSHRIRKMDNLIIEKRISPSSSSRERSRSASPGSARSRKKAKKHVSKQVSPEQDFDRQQRYRSKSPEPHGHKKQKERGRSREPKRKHEKLHQKILDETDDFAYEQKSPEKVKQASHKKKETKYNKQEKPAKKDIHRAEKKLAKAKSAKTEDWSESPEKIYSRNESSDEPVKAAIYHKSSKKELKKHAGRELKRVIASDEEHVKLKRRKYDDVSPLSSPSHSKKHSKVVYEDDSGKKEKYVSEGKKGAAAKSSKKKHKEEETLLAKKRQKDGSLQPMYSDFSSSSKHSQIEYSDRSDYVEERFSDEMSAKEKKKKIKLKKKRKEKEQEMYTGTDKSAFENEDLEPLVDKQSRKLAKKRKNKREGRSLSFSGSDHERSNVKAAEIRAESRRKKDSHLQQGSSKMESGEKPRRPRDGGEGERLVPPAKHLTRDAALPKVSRHRDLTPKHSRRSDNSPDNRRDDIFPERNRREDISVGHVQRDYDVPKQSRMLDVSPKRSHRDVSPRRSREGDNYDARPHRDISTERLRREDIPQKQTYRDTISPRRVDDVPQKHNYREIAPPRHRDDMPQKRLLREGLASKQLRRRRLSPAHQPKPSMHVMSRKGDMQIKEDFPRDIHNIPKRKRDTYLGPKLSANEQYSPEHKDDYSRHERNSGHHSVERTRERDWDVGQNVRHEPARRREPAQRLLPERRLDSARAASGKFIPQRKMMVTPEIFPPISQEVFIPKERWERKNERQPAGIPQRHAPPPVERDFTRPTFAQSHAKPKSHMVKDKYAGADRNEYRSERKYQDKSWTGPAPRNDSKDRKFVSHEEVKERRIRSGSRDSRSSSQHSRDVPVKIRLTEVASREASPRNRSSSTNRGEHQRYDRSESVGRKPRTGTRRDNLAVRQRTERESGDSIERVDKKFRAKAAEPTRGRAAMSKSNDAHRVQKSQKLPSKRRHETALLKVRSSSSSRSSQGREHPGRKQDVSPRRAMLKPRRKTRDDPQDSTRQGQKQGDEHATGRRERKKTEDITDGELTMLIEKEDQNETPPPEPTAVEVDWNELPQTTDPKSPGAVKEPSSVLKNFTPARMLLRTGIATELLSPAMLKKLDALCEHNHGSQGASSEQSPVENILSGNLHSYSDEKLRKRLLGYNARYRHPLVPPAVINAKTYSASMKNYMATCKIAV